MQNKKYTKADAIELLRSKAEETQRLPKRSDFTESEVVAIKAFLGPMPRALEAAGLKEPPKISTLEKNRAKRALKKSQQKNNNTKEL